MWIDTGKYDHGAIGAITQPQGPVAASALPLFDVNPTVNSDWTLVRITA